MIPTLVIGAGGLLGRAIVGATDGARRAHVRWGTRHQAQDLWDAVAGLTADPSAMDVGWRIVWAAGRSVIASDEGTAAAETRALEATLQAAADLLPRGPLGRFVLASSAGGLHAASVDPPFDEATPVEPRSAYGREKLRQERMLARAVQEYGWDGVAVRLGPLYGIGQDPTKSQGLVSALCRAVIDGRPVRIFVPGETRRPYLWAPDGGRIMAGILAGPPREGGDLRVRTIPGGASTTVHQLLETVRRVTRRVPPVLFARDRDTPTHASDLRLSTRFPLETTLPDLTPLTVGVGRLWQAMLVDPVRHVDGRQVR